MAKKMEDELGVNEREDVEDVHKVDRKANIQWFYDRLNYKQRQLLANIHPNYYVLNPVIFRETTRKGAERKDIHNALIVSATKKRIFIHEIYSLF